MTKKSLILASSLIASTILLAASILPAASAQTARPGNFSKTLTFTVEGSSLAELRQQVKEQVNTLPIPNAQKPAVVNDVMAQLANDVPRDGTVVELTITIRIECTFPPLRCTISISVNIG